MPIPMERTRVLCGTHGDETVLRDPSHGIKAILKTSLLRMSFDDGAVTPHRSVTQGPKARMPIHRLRGRPNECFFTMSDNTPPSRQSLPKVRIQVFMDERYRRSTPHVKWWWSQTGSNRRPHACKARALPAELWPHPPGFPERGRRLNDWWAWEDLNLRPHAYQARALTN